MRTKKLFVVLLVLVSSCVLLFAQGAKEDDSNITITLLTRYGDETDINSRVWRKAVAQFQIEHPEITIVDKSVTDEAQFNNLIKTDMASGNIPTIFMTYGGGNLRGYVESGIVRDLTPYFEANKEWIDGFKDSMFSMLTFAGIDGVYAVPYSTYADSLYVNTDLFNRYGIAIPTTIEEFESVCEQFLANGVTPIPIGDKSNFRGGHLFTILMAKRTGQDFVKKLASGEESYDCPEVRDVLNTMKSWAKRGFIGNSITTLDVEGELQQFLTGQSAMVFRNNSVISRMVNESYDDSQIKQFNFPFYADYPEYQYMWHGGSSDAFSISSVATEAEAEAAIKLLKYVTKMEYMVERNELSFGAFSCVLEGLPLLSEQHSITADFQKNLAQATGMIVEPAEYDTVQGLESATRIAIQAMWAGASVDDTIKAIISAKEF